MAWKDCIAEIRAAAGRSGAALSDAEIERMLDAVLRKAKRSSGIGALDSDGLRFAAAAMADEARKASMLEKRNALLAMQARIARRERIESRPDIGPGIQAEIRGIHTPTGAGGGRYSASARWHARERAYVDGITRNLERAGLFKAMRNTTALTRQWARELFELSKGKDGAPGVTGSPEALTIAKILHGFQTRAKIALNRAGGAIGDYAGYITRTSHDMDKIRRAGGASSRWGHDVRAAEKAWKDFVRPLLHADTFDYVGGPGTPESETFLGNVYRALRTGVHLTHEGMQGFKDPAFTGPGNLARRVSQERVLHFKDADSWLAYHERFGTGSAGEAVMENLRRSARATALMQVFGPNPRAEFLADIEYFKDKYRDSDPDRTDRLSAAEQRLNNEFDFLEGKANQPVHRLAAKIFAGTRAVVAMGRLGLVSLAHLSAAATKATELRWQGVNAFERYGNFISSLHPGRSAIAEELLAGYEGMSRDLMSRFNPDDSFPGVINKLSNLSFKWNGLTWLLNHQRQGGEELMAHHLGARWTDPMTRSCRSCSGCCGSTASRRASGKCCATRPIISPPRIWSAARAPI